MSRRKQQNPKHIQDEEKAPKLDLPTSEAGKTPLTAPLLITAAKAARLTVANGNGYHEKLSPPPHPLLSSTPLSTSSTGGSSSHDTDQSPTPSHDQVPKSPGSTVDDLNNNTNNDTVNDDDETTQPLEGYPEPSPSTNTGPANNSGESSNNNSNSKESPSPVFQEGHFNVTETGHNANSPFSLTPKEKHVPASTRALRSFLAPEGNTSNRNHSNSPSSPSSNLTTNSSPLGGGVGPAGLFGSPDLPAGAIGSSGPHPLLCREGGLPKNTCHFCGAVKKGPADLQRHLRKHTGERPFVCSLCDKAFKAKRSLQYHQLMTHGVDTKESSDKFSERRKCSSEQQDPDHHPQHCQQSVLTAGPLTGPHGTMDDDSSGVLDLSKTPPASAGEPPKPVSEPLQRVNNADQRATHADKERLSDSPPLPDSTDSTSNPQAALDNTKNKKEPVSSSGGSGSEGSRTPRRGSSGATAAADNKDSNTADKHCDKLFNPAVFESDEDELPVGKRLTRNQARLASLRRREQEREAAAAEAPPAKVAKMDAITTGPSDRPVTTTNTPTTGTSEGTGAPKEQSLLEYAKQETKGSKKDDVANNNDVDDDGDGDNSEGVDRACPYCGVSCAKPSDMKRHLLVHMETKPFVCKVCDKAFKAHANMLYHQKVVHDLDSTPQQPPASYLSSSAVTHQVAPIDLAQKPLPKSAANSNYGSTAEKASEPLYTIPKGLPPPLHAPPSSADREASRAGLFQHEFYSFGEKQKGSLLSGSLDSSSVTPQSSGPGYSFSSSAIGSSGLLSSAKPQLHSTPLTNQDVPRVTSPAGQSRSSHRSSHHHHSGEEQAYMVEYPSPFPGLKQRISVKNETVLATRLDGVNVSSGATMSLYRCHMCGKMFNYLSKLQCHLSVHFERHISFYTCRMCSSNFKFQLQLRRHLRTVHGMTAYNSKLYSSMEVATVVTPTPTSSGKYHQDSGICSSGQESPPSSQQLLYSSKESRSEQLLPHHHHQSSTSTTRYHHQLEQQGIASSNPLISEQLKTDYDGQAHPEDYSRHAQQLSPPSPPAHHHSQHHQDGATTTTATRSLERHSPSFESQQGEFYHQRFRGSYVCRYCNKVFHRLFSLQRHERVHTGYKPCFCKDCGRGFSETRNLRHHIVRFHGEAPQANPVKQVRRAILSGLSRTSQRLMPVTQDMIVEAYSEEGLTPPIKFKHLSSDNRRLQQQQQQQQHQQQHERLQQGLEPREMDSTTTTTTTSKSFPPQLPDLPEQPQPHQPPALEVPEAAQAPEPSKLANEIREKERLDEDVTVVIPTDAPLDAGPQDTGEGTPLASAPDHQPPTPSATSWGAENVSDTDSSQSNNEIVSAPWKSIMLHKQALKSKRKGKLPHRLLSPGASAADPDARPATVPEDLRVSMEDRRSPLTLEQQVRPSPSSSSSTPGAPSSLNLNPLAALDVPPVTSGANIDSHGQPPSATAVTPGGTPLFLPRGSSSGLLSPGSMVQTSGQLPVLPTTLAANLLAQSSTFAAMSGLRFPGWPQEGMSNPFDDEQLNYARGSSLSRTHSRLNVVRSPVRREEVCKPTVLPDGRAVYRCTYCNKDFGSFSDINRHMDFHEGGLVSLGEPSTSLGTWTKSVTSTTPHLNKRARSSAGLASASLGDIRPYKCKFCDYYARTNSQLKVHMMRHQGIREFHCKLCNYKGVTQSDLNRHMKSQIHMMKAQNECRLCGEGFVSPKNMDKHLALCRGPNEPPIPSPEPAAGSGGGFGGGLGEKDPAD